MSKLSFLLKKIEEEFVVGRQGRYEGYYEIYVNPSRKELSDMVSLSNDGLGAVRFIADREREEVFVGNAELLHDDIAAEVGVLNYIGRGYFPGDGEYETGKIVKIGVSELVKEKEELKEEIVNGEYDWMKQYHFDIESFKERLGWEIY